MVLRGLAGIGGHVRIVSPRPKSPFHNRDNQRHSQTSLIWAFFPNWRNNRDKQRQSKSLASPPRSHPLFTPFTPSRPSLPFPGLGGRTVTAGGVSSFGRSYGPPRSSEVEQSSQSVSGFLAAKERVAPVGKRVNPKTHSSAYETAMVDREAGAIPAQRSTLNPASGGPISTASTSDGLSVMSPLAEAPAATGTPNYSARPNSSPSLLPPLAHLGGGQ